MKGRGMTLSKDNTRKVDKLVVAFKETTGFTLSRSQVVERILDGELKLHEKAVEGQR